MFCNQCGLQYGENAKYCSSCGVPISTTVVSQVSPPINSDIVKLTLFRESQLYLVNPPINIVLDGERYSISNGEKKELALPKGSYQLSLSIGIRKKSYDVILDTNTTIIIKMNRLTGSIEVKFEH